MNQESYARKRQKIEEEFAREGGMEYGESSVCGH